MRYLTSPEKPWVEVETFNYPMGDKTIRKVPELEGTVTLRLDAIPDWELVHQFREMVTGTLHIYLPYLPNARADKDKPNGARVAARIAAAAQADELIVADPHSDVWITEYSKYSNGTVYTLPVHEVLIDNSYDYVIAPDAGAVHRASLVAERFGIPLITATKHRDPATGRLSNYHLNHDLGDSRALVVDDICDGGGTFALLASAAPQAHLDLFVTHGGFTKPDSPVFTSYENIFTTNTYPNSIPNKIDLDLMVINHVYN